MATPQRTCVGCREVTSQPALVRLRADQAGRLHVEPRRGATGRSVYVHPVQACVAQAVRGGFAKSLRRRLQPLDVERLWSLIVSSVTSSGASAPEKTGSNT